MPRWSRRFVTSVVGTAFVLTLKPAVASPSGRDGSTTAARITAAPTTAATSPTPPAWTFDTSGTIRFPPALADGGVVVISDRRGERGRPPASSTVQVLDLATGALRWRGETSGAAVTATPVVADGLLLLRLGDDRLVAMTAATGTLVWSARTGRSPTPPPPPVVAQSTVYVASGDGLVQAFHLPDGFRRWTKRVSGAVVAPPHYSNFLVVATAERPFRSDSRGSLCTIESSAASVSGCRRLPAAATTSPVGRKGLVAVSTRRTPSRSAALVVSGTRIPIKGALTSPVLAGDHLAVASSTGTVRGYETGRLRQPAWSARVGASRAADLRRGGDGLVVAGRNIAALDLGTGTKRWQVAVPDSFFGVSRDPQRIVAVQRRGGVAVIDTQSGELLFDVGSIETPTGAVLSDGVLAWTTPSGSVAAVRVPPAQDISMKECAGTFIGADDEEARVYADATTAGYVHRVIAETGDYHRKSYNNVASVSAEPWAGPALVRNADGSETTHAVEGLQIVVALGHETDCPASGGFWEGAPTRYLYPG